MVEICHHARSAEEAPTAPCATQPRRALTLLEAAPRCTDYSWPPRMRASTPRSRPSRATAGCTAACCGVASRAAAGTEAAACNGPASKTAAQALTALAPGPEQLAAAAGALIPLQDKTVTVVPAAPAVGCGKQPLSRPTVVSQRAPLPSQQHRRCSVDGCGWTKCADSVWCAWHRAANIFRAQSVLKRSVGHAVRRKFIRRIDRMTGLCRAVRYKFLVCAARAERARPPSLTSTRFLKAQT